MLADEVVDVGADVPATESGKTPVGGDGGDLTVVVVELVVDGANEAFRDSVTEEHTEDVVGDGVGVVLVEGQQDQGLGSVEVGVGQERLEKAGGPGTGSGDRGVVAVVGHVGSDEHPLGKSVGFQILVERSEVLDGAETLGVVGDGVVQNSRVVLADVVIGGLVVDDGSVAEALESSVRHVLLVLTVRDTLGVEQIVDAADTAIDVAQSIAIETEVVTSVAGHVIWLTRVGNTEQAVERDTLCSEVLQVWVTSSGREVGVLKPDNNETIKSGTLDIGGRTAAYCSGLGLLHGSNIGGGVLKVKRTSVRSSAGGRVGDGGSGRSGRRGSAAAERVASGYRYVDSTGGKGYCGGRSSNSDWK